MTKPTKWSVRSAKTQISLGICPVWSESSLCAQRIAKDPIFLHTDNTWAMSWENLSMPYANNKGADQPAHLRSLISAFVVCCPDCTIPLVSISKLLHLYQASVAAQAGLSLPGTQTPEDRFSCDGAHILIAPCTLTIQTVHPLYLITDLLYPLYILFWDISAHWFFSIFFHLLWDICR